MGNAPCRAKALNVFALHVRGHRVRLDMRLAGARLALLVFAVEPQQGMQPEEAEGAHQQLHHDLPGNPNLRVAGKIMAIAVRLVTGKAGWHIRQTLLGVVAGSAGLEPVVWMNHGLRIIDPPYLVATVAVVALGRVVVAERTDLTVEGVLVGVEILHMTVAAMG